MGIVKLSQMGHTQSQADCNFISSLLVPFQETKLAHKLRKRWFEIKNLTDFLLSEFGLLCH